LHKPASRKTYIRTLKPLPRHTVLLLLTALLALSACSTKKNTAGSRWWQSFVTRYNVYFNGSEAYKEGALAKEQGHKDNFTEMLPLFTVGSESSRSLGKSQFETAITKCEKAIQLHSIKRKPVLKGNRRLSPKEKAYRSRQEFNPFLKNAWMLMGKAQFQKGDFIEAASTFSYITRHYAPEPAVVAEARAWLARCYAGLDWFYDAEDALSRLRRDSVPPRIRTELAATTADLLLRQGRFEDALPHLALTARKEKRKLQKARLYFLLGQVNAHLGRKRDAYKALQKCLRQSPPYQLAFNARILQTEVLAGTQDNKKIAAKLRRMARDENNKEYLDQVYYALGNIHMADRDTAAAVSAYEKGRKESTRNGMEKGVLLLRLGEIYWQRRQFGEAQKCYGEAVGLLDKEHRDYAEATRRSKVLDELVPFTDAIHLQDSLLYLSTASEEVRLAAIDRVIEALIKKEKEERRARADSAAEARAQENGGGANAQASAQTGTPQGGDNKAWYFYNPMTVAQGKQDFIKAWGRRKLEDNWRRSNRSVVNLEPETGYDYEAEDSLAAEEARTDSLAEAESGEALPDSAQNDPHRREYYLKQIPFSDEAKAAAHETIRDALFNAGIIEKDKLEDFPLAAETLNRLCTNYPDFDKMDEALYQLFLLYSRWGQPDRAEEYRRRIAASYPESERTRLITDPDYERLARFGKEMEDSLYKSTYEAYRQRDNATVERNAALSADKFPAGANRPKFMFLHALSRIGTVDAKTLAAELRELVKQFPESDVSEMAGMIVKGLESGRQIGSGTLDIGSLWSRRTAGMEAAADSAGATRQFSPDRTAPFVFIVAYPTDSLDDEQLLYDLARFNFTGFMVRNFDIQLQRDAQLTQFRISGFGSYDEAHTYAQKIFQDTTLAPLLRKTRIVLISEPNMELLGTYFSFDDYKDFYEKTFAPLEINPELPLDVEEGPVEQYYEDDFTPEELEQRNNEGGLTDDDGGEWYSE